MNENLKFLIKVSIILSPVVLISMITGCWEILWAVIGISLLGLCVVVILFL